jgi:hypothetical protein
MTALVQHPRIAPDRINGSIFKETFLMPNNLLAFALCTQLCTDDFYNLPCYHVFKQTGLRISVKDKACF